jgi:hypothetical protein
MCVCVCVCVCVTKFSATYASLTPRCRHTQKRPTRVKRDILTSTHTLGTHSSCLQITRPQPTPPPTQTRTHRQARLPACMCNIDPLPFEVFRFKRASKFQVFFVAVEHTLSFQGEQTQFDTHLLSYSKETYTCQKRPSNSKFSRLADSVFKRQRVYVWLRRLFRV